MEARGRPGWASNLGGMNVKRMIRDDVWIVLLIAVVTLCVMVGMGVHAQNRRCEDVADHFGNSHAMCKGQRRD